MCVSKCAYAGVSVCTCMCVCACVMCGWGSARSNIGKLKIRQQDFSNCNRCYAIKVFISNDIKIIFFRHTFAKLIIKDKQKHHTFNHIQKLYWLFLQSNKIWQRIKIANDGSILYPFNTALLGLNTVYWRAI